MNDSLESKVIEIDLCLYKIGKEVYSALEKYDGFKFNNLDEVKNFHHVINIILASSEIPQEEKILMIGTLIVNLWK